MSRLLLIGAAALVVGAGATPASTPHRPTDSVTSLPDAVQRIEACTGDCSGVVYVWTDRMPLSRAGLQEISAAAESLDIELTLLATEALDAYARGEAALNSAAESLLASGALAHAPAVVAYEDARVVGPAILGYKTADAYESAVRRRLAEATPPPASAPADATSPRREPASLQTPTELEAIGSPGAYFRWVPGREALAYESGGRIYLLDLTDGESYEAPGYVDFVPTPDGRFFVTPGPRRRGLEFYDADESFDAARAGEPGRVEPFFTDSDMRDQYPSVGILEQGEGRTRYRVLTSWFEGIAYRDYEVETEPVDASVPRGAAPAIRPLGEPREPCAGMRLSIPIMSQDGLEVAARDESTGTTKIFRILEGGRCDEVEDLGVQTGKVAWHWSGRLLAFARPPLSSRRRTRRTAPGDASELPGGSPDGIFLYDRDASADSDPGSDRDPDRDEGRMTRVPGSEDASSVVFPEFIGNDMLVYVVPGGSGEPSVFRFVEGVR